MNKNINKIEKIIIYGDRIQIATAMTVCIHPLCYEYLHAYNILNIMKCMYCSKSSELTITLLLVNIVVNTECETKPA